MKIYIAGPYSAPTEEERLANVNAAIDVGIDLMHKGHTPLIPHLTHYVDLRYEKKCGQRAEWEVWMAMDIQWLKHCDGLFFIGESKGANLERRLAVSMGMPVWYQVGDVPSAWRGEKV